MSEGKKSRIVPGGIYRRRMLDGKSVLYGTMCGVKALANGMYEGRIITGIDAVVIVRDGHEDFDAWEGPINPVDTAQLDELAKRQAEVEMRLTRLEQTRLPTASSDLYETSKRGKNAGTAGSA